MQPETYISVDVETSGPVPKGYALLSIGACLVDDPSVSFYAELQPDSLESTPEAMAVHGLSMEALLEDGQLPEQAMQDFAAWVARVTLRGHRPVFVAFNAPFDWMFVASYFHRYLGTNPFGHSAIDIKAFYMGQTGVSWGETSLAHVSAHLLDETHLVHNALSDAQDQARIFQRMLKNKQG